MQCRLTMDWLNKNRFTVSVLDAVEHMDELMEYGFRAAPVVTAPDGKTWSGFRPDLLEKYVTV